jgi:hypothetical protein
MLRMGEAYRYLNIRALMAVGLTVLGVGLLLALSGWPGTSALLD